MNMHIPLGKPNITYKEINEVVDVMKSGILIGGEICYIASKLKQAIYVCEESIC
jgi:dTDP-4-amino-4,6-dideoxygalactose transaminase